MQEEQGQSQTSDKPVRLPELRQDLQIMQGTRHHNGSRSWLIFDPVRHQYFQIGEAAVHILGKWELCTVAAIKEVLLAEGIEVEDSEFQVLIEFLDSNYLTVEPIDSDYRKYSSHAKKLQKKWWEYLVHNYLFFRIPLVRPHKFLARTYPAISFIYTKAWFAFVIIVGLIGLYLTIRQWDVYKQTFLYFFNAKGFVFYALSLVFVKIIHELGHAYTSTRYGCRVTSIGLAFLVMFPVLYTDTTDSWRLPARKKRLAIDAAGVSAELMLAIFSTFLWAFLPDGIAKSVAFFIATTSWVLSVTVNVNPFLRFDGYYFLSDFIGVQNLQNRSFDMGKWSLREKLFGLGVDAPEEMSHRRARVLITYAWLTWIYRFFLFLGIAFLVYALFFKALGVMLFVVEIIWFILMPIYKEIKVWLTMREKVIESKRSHATFAILFALFLVCIIPWNTTLKVPAIMEASEHVQLFPHEAGKITAIHLNNGDEVKKGDVLVELTSPSMVFGLEQTRHKINILNQRLGRITADAQEREQAIILQRELQREKERLVGLNAQLENLNIRAPIDGIVTDFDDSLHMNRWINTESQVAVVEAKSGIQIRGFVDAEDIQRIQTDSSAKFIPENHQLDKIEGIVSKLSQANAEVISIPSLTSRYGGRIAVSETEQDLEPLGTWYSVIVDLPENQLITDRIERGVIFIKGTRAVSYTHLTLPTTPYV